MIGPETRRLAGFDAARFTSDIGFRSLTGTSDTTASGDGRGNQGSEPEYSARCRPNEGPRGTTP